jgi:hypothetical protein
MFSFDASTPSALVQLDAEAWGFLNAVDLSVLDDTRAFVADGQLGLRYVDRTNPANLLTTSITAVGSQARDVAVAVSPEEGVLVEEVYVAGDFYGLYLFRDGALAGQYPSGDRGIGVATRTPGGGPTDLIALAGGEAGVYLFAGAGTAALTVAAQALNSPVTPGQRLRIGVSLTNNTGGPLTGDLVLDVSGPGGVTATRTLLTGATLPAGAATTAVFRARVPGGAPAGSYDAVVSATAGGTSFDAPFTFEVSGTALAARGALGTDAFAVEVEDDGGLLSTAPGAEATAQTTEGLALAAVAPNPVRGTAVVRYTLPETGRADLAVYDLLGRRLATLSEGLQPAGPHEARLDAAALGLANGVYVVRLTTEAGTAATRVTVLR